MNCKFGFIPQSTDYNTIVYCLCFQASFFTESFSCPDPPCRRGPWCGTRARRRRTWPRLSTARSTDASPAAAATKRSSSVCGPCRSTSWWEFGRRRPVPAVLSGRFGVRVSTGWWCTVSGTGWGIIWKGWPGKTSHSRSRVCLVLVCISKFCHTKMNKIIQIKPNLAK